MSKVFGQWLILGFLSSVTGLSFGFLKYLPSSDSSSGYIVAQAPQDSSGRTWHSILGIFRRESQRIGGRREFCLLSPLPRSAPAWHDQPLFIWHNLDRHGNPRQIDRIQLTQEIGQEPFWGVDSPQVTTSNNYGYFQYNGSEKLRPGVYRLGILLRGERDLITTTLQIMESEKREAINTELAKISAATPEELALRRSLFFGEQRLVADAIQELFLVYNPSPDWGLRLEQVIREICGLRGQIS